MNNVTKVIFLSGGINPDSAPFNRFFTIYKMVREAGFSASVILVRPVPKERITPRMKISKRHLMFEDLVYENVQVFDKKGLFKKIFLRLKVYLNSVNRIRKNSASVNAVLYLGPVSLTDYLFFFFIAKLYNLKYVRERSEFPLLIRNPVKFRTVFYKYFILPWNYKFFDGMVIMTQPLIDFYSKYTKKKCEIVKIPMTVDPGRFRHGQKKDLKYIGYVGGLNCQKDGLDILIKSFSRISQQFPDYRLKIAGSPAYPEEKEILVNLVKQLMIEERVDFVGRLNRSEIPGFLLSSSVLVLARPDSKQAEGGFPTKLGEYLMTGNPVIVTDVGEISSYLENGRNAFIIQPGSENELAEKLALVLGDKEKSKSVGMEGRKAAERYFDFNNYVDRMRDFIMAIV